MEILFNDKNIIACIKPAGIDSEKQVPEILKEQLGGEIFTLHRLDLNVSGVMIYARNKFTAGQLSKAIQNGEMIKEYIAVVHGTPPEEGIWEDLLWKDSRKNKVFVVKRMRKGVKKAKLQFDVISQKENTSKVHIRLFTGRSHQIRVQFASRGFPLVGDHKYGSKDKRTAPMLYSTKITFPYKNQQISFSYSPDESICSDK